MFPLFLLRFVLTKIFLKNAMWLYSNDWAITLKGDPYNLISSEKCITACNFINPHLLTLYKRKIEY